MGRFILAMGLLLAGGSAAAEARLLPEASRIEDRWRGIVVELAISEAVPWRVYMLDAPWRLVVELQGAGWEGDSPGSLIDGDNAAGAVVEGADGRTRLVVELARPLAVVEAGMAVAEDGARLRLVLEATTEEAFAAGALGDAPEPAASAAPEDDGRFVVAIDPGHGGIDPGAERDGLREAHLMLALGQELARAVESAGMVAVLTRDADVFVPLQGRMSRARAAGADVLLSLHADALDGEAASGASVYTLTEEGASSASGGMVQRHEGGDLIAGLDLLGQEDEVATALMDLARLDTQPRSERLAAAVAQGLAEAGAAVNRRALRQANLAVLKAADIPSVLVEVGFLSDPGDRLRLSTAEGRAAVVTGLVAALEAWAEEDAARGPLLRR